MGSNFEFIYYYSDDKIRGPKVTMSFDRDCLTEIIPHFEEFLRGCGFSFQGHLEFVDDCEE